MEQEEEQNWAERYTPLLIHRVTTFLLNTDSKDKQVVLVASGVDSHFSAVKRNKDVHCKKNYKPE